MKTNESYENCKECNGRGYVIKHGIIINRCRTCYGLGKLDWATNVTKNLNEKCTPGMQELVDRWTKDREAEVFIIRWENNWALAELLKDGRFINQNENQ